MIDDYNENNVDDNLSFKDSSGESYTEDDVNIARERTFNSELEDLLQKIDGHDLPLIKEITPDDIDFDSITPEDLLFHLHRLFYKTRNLMELNISNTSFNPFDIFNYYKESDLPEAIMKYIEKELSNISSKYSILTFNFKERCYQPFVFKLDGLSEENIVLSLTDRLYNKINSSEYGYILKTEEIGLDNHLSLKFTDIDDNITPVYILSSEKFTSNLIKDITEKNLSYSIQPSPIIILQSDDFKNNRPEEIYNEIENKLTVPIQILNNLLFNFKGFSNDDITHYLDIIKYISVKYLNSTNDSAYQIKFTDVYKVEDLHLISYLKSRLRKELNINSSIIHFNKNSILIISSDAHIRDTIDKIIDNFRGTISVYIEIEKLKRSDFRNTDELILKLLQN